jgi:hypothetical protein
MVWTDEEIEEILRDEDFDLDAIYVLGDKKFDFASPKATEVIERAFKEAMKECRRKHKEAGVPMVVERDGEIVYIQPDEIEIE